MSRKGRIVVDKEGEFESSECNVCGQNHCTDSCPFLTTQCMVKDASTPSHARLTLPTNLRVKDLADGTTTVVAKARFLRGTRFGPFQAALTYILPPEVNFPLKIFGPTEEDSFYLDTRNEDNCNWMCLVAPVSTSNEAQNLICYQVRRDVFFSSLRDIEPGEELRVWYAPYYAVKMGVGPKKIPSPCPSPSANDKDMEVIDSIDNADDVIEKTVKWEADTTTDDVSLFHSDEVAEPISVSELNPIALKSISPNSGPKRKGTRDIKLKKHIIEKAVTSYVAEKLPPWQLGARFTPPCWRCRECGAKEVSVINYAHHLMQHLKPSTPRPKNFPCSLCHKKFHSQELLNNHEESVHGLSDLLKTQPPPAVDATINNQNSHSDDVIASVDIKTEEEKSDGIEPVTDPPVISIEESCSKSDALSSALDISIAFSPPDNASSTQQEESSSVIENTALNPCVSQSGDLVLDNTSLCSANKSKECSSIENVSPELNVQPLQNGENGRTLVAVMGESGLNYLAIPIDQEKNVQTLLQNIQEPTSNKTESQVSEIPDTILNHEFFTCVAGETVVQDVKSLLSKGYSLQFLVEDEDGSSSLVDVLSTANGTQDQVTSSTDALQSDKNSSPQLVVVANGNIPSAVPPALQNILPSTVPIVPSVVDVVSVPEINPLTHSTALNVPQENLNLSHENTLSSCLPPDNSFTKKQNLLSMRSNLLPSSIESSVCYNNDFLNSNADAASLIDMNLTEKGLEKELDIDLGALGLAVEDANSTDYMLNSCSTPPPSVPKSHNLQSDLNGELNTPVKLLDQCINNSLPSDVMSFSFENEQSSGPLTCLDNALDGEKNATCVDSLTKDFNDLIAADADSSNMVLNIQPADSTAESGQKLSVSVVEFDGKVNKDAFSSAVNWMENEVFTMQSGSSSSVLDSDLVHSQPSLNVSFETSTLVELSETDVNDEVAAGTLDTFSNDMEELLLDTHSDNVPSDRIETQSLTEENTQAVEDSTEAAQNNTQTAEEIEPDVEMSLIASGPPFICDICNKSFARVGYLYRHLRKHTGEFTCVFCHAVFARRENLQSHLCSGQLATSSSASKRFICPLCQRQFSTKTLLTRHISNHGGSLSCKSCSRSFPRKEMLKQHTETCSHALASTGGEVHMSCEESEKVSEQIFEEDSDTENASIKSSVIIRCPTCQLIFITKEDLERHELTHHSGSGRPVDYSCSHCGRDMFFASPEKKKNHISVCAPAAALQAGTATSINCPNCDEPFRLLVLYRQHIYQHTHPLVCAHCRRRFHSLQERGMHDCLDISERCSECGRQFGTVPQLEKHRLTHGVPTHHCFECGRSYHKTNEFKHHRCFELKTKLSRKNPKVLADLKELSAIPSLFSSKKTGTRRVSHNEHSFICEVCGEVCKSAPRLRVHRLLHGERRFACNICEKRFHRKDVLAEHMYTHQDAQLRCPVCSKLLKSKKTLHVHMRQHFDTKQFSCQVCGKEFHQKVNLKRHMVHHSPQSQRPSPVKCPQCGRRFRLANSLAKHMLKHTEGPRFPCSVCDVFFANKTVLKQHMKGHMGGGQCPVCSRTLKYRRSLQRHMFKLHPETPIKGVTKPEDTMTTKTVAVEAKAMDEGAECQAMSPEVLLTVSQIQLTTDGVQQLSLAEDTVVEGSCLLEEGSLTASEDMVLYVLQDPLPCLPMQEPSA